MSAFGAERFELSLAAKVSFPPRPAEIKCQLRADLGQLTKLVGWQTGVSAETQFRARTAPIFRRSLCFRLWQHEMAYLGRFF